MRELEKITEEIDQRIRYYRDYNPRDYVDVCAGLTEAKKIIQKHIVPKGEGDPDGK